jgi:hypothetical protein
MAVFDLLNKFNYNFRTKIFRREVEASFFSNKKLRLPQVNYITQDSLKEFKETYPFNFYSNEDDYRKASEILKLIEPSDIIISEADEIIENRYNLFCSGEIYLGEKINWHFDYKGKYEWQKTLAWRGNFFNFPKGVDIKYPWELARFHQGLKLGEAYLLTREEKYTVKFLELYSDFISQNGFCSGIHWIDSSESAIRLINVLFGFSFFMLSADIDAAVINSLIDFVLYHSIFIENNLPYERNRDHKYLISLLGLFLSGLFFKEVNYGKKNLQFAGNGLEQEIRLQIYEDGISREQSLPFHSIILETFYLAEIFGRRTGMNFSQEFKDRLYKMFKVYSAYLRNDLSIPSAGDDISSRILDFRLHNTADYSFPLPAGAMIFKESEFKRFHDKITAELLFLFGIYAKEDYESIPISEEKNYSTSSAGFIKGKHFIFRNKDLHFFIDAGELGIQGSGAHVDIFNFELFYKNNKIIVDPGTFSCYADNEIRNRFRAEISHNIFCIDDEPLSRLEGLFKIKEDLTKPKILEWESSETEDILVAQHYAYARLPDPVICKRTFHFLKEKNLIKIKDEFFGGKKHKAVFNITFHPDIELTQHNSNEYSAEKNGVKIKVKFHSSAEYFFTSIQEAFYSEHYGCLTKTKKIYTVSEEKFPAFVITDIELL